MMSNISSEGYRYLSAEHMAHELHQWGLRGRVLIAEHPNGGDLVWRWADLGERSEVSDPLPARPHMSIVLASYHLVRRYLQVEYPGYLDTELWQVNQRLLGNTVPDEGQQGAVDEWRHPDASSLFLKWGLQDVGALASDAQEAEERRADDLRLAAADVVRAQNRRDKRRAREILEAEALGAARREREVRV